MTSSFPGASLVAIGLLSLLSACASTPSADSQPADQKVASNCEDIPATTGSFLGRRVCKPSPANNTPSTK